MAIRSLIIENILRSVHLGGLKSSLGILQYLYACDQAQLI